MTKTETVTYVAGPMDPMNAINFYLWRRDGGIGGSDFYDLEGFLRLWVLGDFSEWPEYLTFCETRK